MPEFSVTDSAHMARALRLAERGRYTAHPNPLVGCVLVRDGVVVGEGWHEKTGDAHAEVNALRAAGNKAHGATAYVTLEPCAHLGKTPPCTSALIDAGIARVVAAMQDPNPSVAGGGLEVLGGAGIDVQLGLMRDTAMQLNPGFIKRVTHRRPFVRVKVACSLDGAIAMSSGESQWITGPEARDDVHRLRARSGAVLTGIGTVLADDPSLNVRNEKIETGGLQPLRVVLDSQLRMPTAARMLSLAGTTLVCCVGKQAGDFVAADAEVHSFPAVDGHVDADAVFVELAQRDINEVLVEAGPALVGHLLERNLVDELVIYQAPHIMGSQTKQFAETPGWTMLADRLDLDIIDVRCVGSDTRITAIPYRKE
tara:strand:- start:5872 stop:6975 length:1104 start_codon:yes stop_codon:yes gene_type:complete